MLTKSFYGCEDQNLTAKLLTELPGILNCAVAGLGPVERRGHFQQPELAKEAVEQLGSGPIKALAGGGIRPFYGEARRLRHG